MGYASNIAYYKAELEKSAKAGNRDGARLNAMAYAKLLRAMGQELKSIKDKAVVNNEADKYDLIAAYITKEGISQRVLQLLGLAPTPTPAPSAPASKKSPAKKAEAPKSPPPRKTSSGMDIAKMLSGIGSSGASSSAVKVAEPPAASVANPPVMTTPVVNSPSNTASAPAPAATVQASAVHSSGDEWSADMFERYLGATAVVHADCSSGTGFFISEEGYLITNHHVVYEGSEAASEISVASGDDKNYGGAKLIAADRKHDVALLKLKSPRGKTPYIPLVKDYSTVRAGTDMMIIGNGLSFGLAPITGTVKFPSHHGGDTLVYTAPTNAGDSGSPVINRAGECIGIHRAREDEQGRAKARGIAYATPAEFIASLLKEWQEEYGLKL